MRYPAVITLDIEPMAMGEAFGKVSQLRVESSSMELLFGQDYLTLDIGTALVPVHPTASSCSPMW